MHSLFEFFQVVLIYLMGRLPGNQHLLAGLHIFQFHDIFETEVVLTRIENMLEYDFVAPEYQMLETVYYGFYIIE